MNFAFGAIGFSRHSIFCIPRGEPIDLPPPSHLLPILCSALVHGSVHCDPVCNFLVLAVVFSSTKQVSLLTVPALAVKMFFLCLLMERNAFFKPRCRKVKNFGRTWVNSLVVGKPSQSRSPGSRTERGFTDSQVRWLLNRRHSLGADQRDSRVLAIVIRC